MGKESFPLIKMWEDAGDLPRENAEDAGNLPATYFTKLDDFFKPKQNTMMAIREVWTNFQQGNEELNSWIARISNSIQLASYHELPPDMTIKDRLVRDILLCGCNSQKAKTRIMKEEAGILLPAVINILQEEKQTTQYDAKSVHYVKYDAKKGKEGRKLSHTERNQILRRNATDVVKHSLRITWNTVKPRMLRADLAIRLGITRNVVRNQGTFQDKALKRHTF